MTRVVTPAALMPRPGELGAVAVGGSLGALLRAMAGHAWEHSADGWPWSTLVVNVVGCFALAALLVLVAAPTTTSRGVRLLLGTGLCGGFTTFSTVMHDADRLGRTAWSVGYLAVSVATMVAAAGLGWLVTTRLTARRARS